MRKFSQYIRQAYAIVPTPFRNKIKWSFFFTLLNGLLDIVSLAMLIPVILIFLNPDQITTNPIIFNVYEKLGLSSQSAFQTSILIGIILLFILKNMISVWVNYYISKTVFDISTDLSKASIESFFNKSYLEYTRSNSAIISRKIKTIPHDFANYILIPQLNIIAEFIIAGIIIIAISLYSPIICLMLTMVMLPILLAWKWFKKQHLNQIENDFKEKYPASLKFLFQGIDSYIDVKLYQKEAFFIEKFIKLKREMNKNYAYLKTASFLPPKILEVALIISIALIFGYTTFYNLQVELIPLLSLFIAGFYRLYPSVTRIVNALTSINAYNYVLEELRPESGNNKTIKKEIHFTQRIQFEQISFSYPGKEALFKNIDLEFHKGQCIGISGDSGSGKTTLVKLLTGLVTPDSGRVMIDDVAFSGIHIHSMLSKIGYLQQQPVIIDASLEENIAFGEHESDTQKLLEVIRQTNLEDFVASLPDKLSTHLGENGIQISGGQRQRIALARALYRNSELFIFDEISNNLDKTNLIEVCKSIVKLLSSGKTVLIIDHNPLLLKMADKIWSVSKCGVIETEKSFSPL